MPLSKPFCIATSGPTIDGRTIQPEWLESMAKNYDQKVYTAVANLEHYLSSLPDGIFKAFGKVVSLKTQEAEVLGQKRTQLFATVDASQEIVDLQKKGQKAFASMEISQIGNDTVYLTGLAFTDTPASLGTETMKFSHAGSQVERFAAQDDVAIEFEEAPPAESPGNALFAKIKALLSGNKKDADARFADQSNSIEAIALSQKDLLENFASIEQQMADMGAQIKLNVEAIAARASEFAALQQKLTTTDGDQSTRPAATGGDGYAKTDC